MMCVIIAANYLDTGWAAGMGLVMPQDFGAVLHIGGAKPPNKGTKMQQMIWRIF